MFKQVFIFLLLLLPLAAYPQLSNKRFRIISPVPDTLQLDTLTLVPGTLRIAYPSGEVADSNTYTLLGSENKIVFRLRLLDKDSLLISYKVFPLNLEKERYHKDVRSLRKDMSLAQNPLNITYQNTYNNPSFYSGDGLSKNGSISRGISFGNNQDVVVNSNMNLQVSGKLTKDIDLVLAATDNNIPVQPDGNTQQLQEFDKVYIQLNDKNSKLTVGDFQLSRPNSYFMNFYKRTQGLLLANTYLFEPQREKSPVLKTSVSGAVSRGRFARNVIQGIENNQGPYRLKGADNELFIIVLSGTEKVYIDGRLLQRGQENDYVIDYNTSEITFTARQLITKDRRIVAEFQYAERNYARSLYFLGEEYNDEKLKLRFNYYSEQDNKNKVFQQRLSQQEKLKLYEIGDTLDKAVTSGASIAEFNTTEVFYRKLDTATSNGTWQIYVYATQPDTAYRVKFSYVGEGKGNYKQVKNAANGKVYQWFEPVNGIKQGNYEPVLLLVSPKKKQMATASVDYLFNANHFINTEGVYTVNDLNTFSPIDSRDDEGSGVKVNYSGKSILSRSLTDSVGKRKSAWILNYTAAYEFVQRHFSQIERFRSVEFTRDWNRSSDSIKNDQHLYSAGIGFGKSDILKSNYALHAFTEGHQYQGFRHLLNNNLTTTYTKASYNASFLNSESATRNTTFYRHKSKISHQVKQLLFTYLDEFENNRFYTPSRDSLYANSYNFWEWEGSISNADTTGNRYQLFYRERSDKKAWYTVLKNVAYAQSVGFSADLVKTRNHPFRTTFVYRKLNVNDTNLITTKPDNTILSRIEYSPRLWKGFIQSTLFYETGYGLEPRKEYSFIQVAAGQGQYTWKDYNNNNIKELNEFEIAQFSDQATYIKVFTPTSTYIKAGHNQFSGNVFLRPAVFKTGNSSKFFGFLSRFVSQTVYRVDKKTSGDRELNLNPFNVPANDSLLLFINSSFRQALFFNQNSSVAGFDYTYQENKSKQLLTNGFESRNIATHELRIRWNINRAWSLFNNSTIGLKTNSSQYFSTRNYAIFYYETEPKLSYQPNTAFRINMVYKHSEKKNTAEGGFQRASMDDYALELKYNQLSKGSFNLRTDFVQIRYNDVENSPLAFEMLNALKTGDNFNWNLSYQHNLTANMQISINYDGRKPPGTKAIHIGGAQVRAFF